MGYSVLQGEPKSLTALTVQVLTSGTGATYTPTSGTKFWRVTCTGGGGGGGGSDCSSSTNNSASASGGSGGGTAIAWFDATEMGANAVYTVGPGGGGGANTGGDGTAGTASTFNPAGTGATLSGGGGLAGDGVTIGANASITGVAVDGGTASGGDINIDGGDANEAEQYFANAASVEVGLSSIGGNSFFGSGGKGVISFNGSSHTAGTTALQYGAGGGGASGTSSTTGAVGGDGAPGIIIVEEFA